MIEPVDATGAASDAATLLGEHNAAIGPISGAWQCPCGEASTNGSIHTNDLTTADERRGQFLAHVAAVLDAAKAAEVRAARADAWDEAHRAFCDCEDFPEADDWKHHANPYRRSGGAL